MTRWIASAISAVLLTGCAAQAQREVPPVTALQPSGASDSNRRVVLRVYDAQGKRIDWASFREIADNGRSGNGLDDALLDPEKLTMTRAAPLFSSNGAGDGDPALTLPAEGSAALSLAWPTSDGYSNLIFDLPDRGGTFDFNQLASQQVLGDVAASLSARPWYRPGTKVTALYAAAKREYSRGRFPQSLNAGVSAEMLLLVEAGVAYAASTPTPMTGARPSTRSRAAFPNLKPPRAFIRKTGGCASASIPGKSPNTTLRRSRTPTN